MKNKLNLEKILKSYLLFGGVYMIFESLIHLSQIRLVDVKSNWPDSALIYATLFNYLYGSFALFLAALVFYLQKNLVKNRNLINLLAIFAFLHASLVVFLSLNFNFDLSFAQFNSLRFWIPIYNFYLLFEAILLYFFCLLVYLWNKK